MIDLHIHTDCSDGQFSPQQTIKLAVEAGVTIAAVTDHDTVSGLEDAAAAADAYGMTFFPGIEISVQGHRELHILGYGIDTTDTALVSFCQKHARLREERCDRILTYLQQRGVTMTRQEVERYQNGATNGRPHFARALVEKGYAATVQDAFATYLATPEFYATVERPKPSPEEGIHVIRQAGGVAVMAHPYLLGLEYDALSAVLQKLVAMGLQGIEGYYSKHTAAQTALYLQLAEQYDLLVTCGSDFHGPAIKPDIALGTGINGSLCRTDSQISVRLQQAIAVAQNRSIDRG